MTRTHTVALIVGSARRDSVNRRLAEALVRLAPPSLQFQQVRIDDLPIYNGDLEAARPEAARRLSAQVQAADAVLFVTPEHNRSLPALLKNAIDWGSRPLSESVWRNKPVAIAGTSPGAVGALVAQQHLRLIMGALSATVLGGDLAVSARPGLIDDHGGVTDEATRQLLQAHLTRFAALVDALADPA